MSRRHTRSPLDELGGRRPGAGSLTGSLTGRACWLSARHSGCPAASSPQATAGVLVRPPGCLQEGRACRGDQALGLPVAAQTIMPSLLHRRGRDKLGPWGPLSNAAALGAACSPGWADGCACSEPRRFRDSIATATATPPLVSSGAARGRLSQEPGVGELPVRACAELQRRSPGRGGVLGGGRWRRSPLHGAGPRPLRSEPPAPFTRTRMEAAAPGLSGQRLPVTRPGRRLAMRGDFDNRRVACSRKKAETRHAPGHPSGDLSVPPRDTHRRACVFHSCGFTNAGLSL